MYDVTPWRRLKEWESLIRTYIKKSGRELCELKSRYDIISFISTFQLVIYMHLIFKTIGTEHLELFDTD